MSPEGRRAVALVNLADLLMLCAGVALWQARSAIRAGERELVAARRAAEDLVSDAAQHRDQMDRLLERLHDQQDPPPAPIQG